MAEILHVHNALAQRWLKAGGYEYINIAEINVENNYSVRKFCHIPQSAN